MAVTAILFILTITGVLGKYESAGCSDEGCGIPCYLRPAEDECHYTEHTSPCAAGGASDLEQQLWYLNNSLVRLKEKLVQKRVIPAGGACVPMSVIDHGGVFYSDLLLSVGVSATFVCEEGYSLHGYSLYECAIGGVWVHQGDGSVITNLPVCEESATFCDPLVSIPHGHVSYQTIDTVQIQPGDVVTYICDPMYTLEGAIHRICMRNGTWSSEEPTCIIAEPLVSLNASVEGIVDGDDKIQLNYKTILMISGGTVGVIVLICIVLSAIMAIICSIRKKLRKKRESSKDVYVHLPATGDPKDETVTLKPTSTHRDTPQSRVQTHEHETKC